MKRLIDNDLLIIPGPGIFTARICQITLFGVVIVDLKEKIPGFAVFDQEGIRYKARMHILHIFRPKQRIDPALELIEMKRRITAVNSDRPLFASRNKWNSAFHHKKSAAGKSKEQECENKDCGLS